MSNGTMTYQLVKKIKIAGTLTAVTGLHIGGNNVGLQIGGADATVVRNPYTNEPYIPGSSLKGKIRSLLERSQGKFTSSGIAKAGPYTNDPHDPICQVFGLTPESLKSKDGESLYQPVSRLIVRDAMLQDDSRAKLRKSKTTDMPYTEVKTEVVIDRVTSKATPRQLERVPAGSKFEFAMILDIYNADAEQEPHFINLLLEGFALLQDDYLCGKGTRGSGQVTFSGVTLVQKTIQDYADNQDWGLYLHPNVTNRFL